MIQAVAYFSQVITVITLFDILPALSRWLPFARQERGLFGFAFPSGRCRVTFLSRGQCP